MIVSIPSPFCNPMLGFRLIRVFVFDDPPVCCLGGGVGGGRVRSGEGRGGGEPSRGF